MNVAARAGVGRGAASVPRERAVRDHGEGRAGPRHDLDRPLLAGPHRPGARGRVERRAAGAAAAASHRSRRARPRRPGAASGGRAPRPLEPLRRRRAQRRPRRLRPRRRARPSGDLGCDPGRFAEEYYAVGADGPQRWDCGSGCDGCERPGDGHGHVSPRQAELLRLATAAEIQRHPGTVLGGWQRWAEQVLPSKIDWRRVLAAEVRSRSPRWRGWSSTATAARRGARSTT